MNVYTIYDSKAEAYLTPFFEKTDGLAIRLFQRAANDPEHNFNRYAEDYTLFRIGSFFEQAGELVKLVAPEALGTALSFVTNIKPNGPTIVETHGANQGNNDAT